MTKIPKDPYILLSYINTQLRDFYPSIKECCLALNIDQDKTVNTLEAIDYYYDEKNNQFV